MDLYTIGHSTRSFAEFASLLKRYGIKILVDVRAFPTSTRNPQFAREELKQKLLEEGIEYAWLGEELGGYRRGGLGAQSPNKGWETEGFRNYADYMISAPFKRGIEKLLKFAASKRLAPWNKRWDYSTGLAYMCAERFYWRCHRRLISDYLVANGHRVLHIVDEARTIEHKLPNFAEVIDGELRYPFPKCTKKRG